MNLSNEKNDLNPGRGERQKNLQDWTKGGGGREAQGYGIRAVLNGGPLGSLGPREVETIQMDWSFSEKKKKMTKGGAGRQKREGSRDEKRTVKGRLELISRETWSKGESKHLYSKGDFPQLIVTCN